MDSEGEEVPKVSLPRKPRDAQCPKKGLTSYFLFAQKVREETKAEFPKMAITEIAKEISKKWKLLAETEKAKYSEEALRLKGQYVEKMKEYEDSDAQKAYKLKLEEWERECDRRKNEAVCLDAVLS